MSTDIKFEGWLAKDKHSIEGKMEWGPYEPKKLTSQDVTIKIECCGICASDLHTISSGWGEADYPVVTGHEIVGTIVEVGDDVKHLKVGQRVGVGAQSDSCKECDLCDVHRESYCRKGQVGTYNSRYTDGSGKSYGGYAKYNRVPSRFAIPIPENLDSVTAAPLMCGGITVYSPLVDNFCGQKDFKRVGVVGIGGLGHFALVFAKALGAEQIVAISHTDSKKELAHKLGATDFVATANKDFDKPWKKNLDLLIITANNADMPVHKFVGMLRPLGRAVMVGIPEKPMQPIPVGALVFAGAYLGGSAIGGTTRIAEMLKLAGDKKLDFLIEKRDMKEANQAVVDMNAGKARFRYVLVNEA